MLLKHIMSVAKKKKKKKYCLNLSNVVQECQLKWSDMKYCYRFISDWKKKKETINQIFFLIHRMRKFIGLQKIQ